MRKIEICEAMAVIGIGIGISIGIGINICTGRTLTTSLNSRKSSWRKEHL